MTNLINIQSGDVVFYSRTICDEAPVVSFLPVVRVTKTMFSLPNGQRFNKYTGALVGSPFDTATYVRRATAEETSDFLARVATATALLDEQAA